MFDILMADGALEWGGGLMGLICSKLEVESSISLQEAWCVECMTTVNSAEVSVHTGG